MSVPNVLTYLPALSFSFHVLQHPASHTVLCHVHSHWTFNYAHLSAIMLLQLTAFKHTKHTHFVQQLLDSSVQNDTIFFFNLPSSCFCPLDSAHV